MENTVSQNPRAQTAAAFKEFFRAGRDCAIHPITGTAFAHSMKANALDFEFLSDERRKIDIARDDIAAH